MRCFNPYLDVRSLGAFRIVLGAVLILDLLFYKLPVHEVFYSNQGIFDPATVDAVIQHDPTRWWYNLGLLSFIQSPGGVVMVFTFTLICYSCFTLGIRTRWFGILSFVLLWSIHQRNPMVVSGPDELLINLLFVGLFLPLDQRFSWTRSRPEMKLQHKSFASFYALFFIGMMYFFQAFLKTGHLWENGEALSYALMEDLWIKSPAHWLANYPDACHFLTHATVYLEYAILPLLFFPWWNEKARLLVMLLLMGFHWAIFIFLDFALFPLIISSVVLLIAPSSFWELCRRLLPRLRWKWPVKSVRSMPRALQQWQQKLATPFLVAFLLLIVWKSAVVAPQWQASLPHPSWMKQLYHTTLLRQDWGFYGPNPSITHGWFKTVGVTAQNAMIDLRTKQSYQPNEQGLEAYKDYPWELLYYNVVLRGFPQGRRILDNWGNYEYRKLLENGEQQFLQVQILGFKQTITAPQQAKPLQISPIAYAPR